MRNITISVADELYHRARIAAAERDQTVTAMVREFLEHLSPGPSGHQQRVAGLFRALDNSRNSRSVGPLRREELHDR